MSEMSELSWITHEPANKVVRWEVACEGLECLSLTLLEMGGAALFPTDNSNLTSVCQVFVKKKSLFFSLLAQIWGLISLSCSEVADINNVFTTGIHTDDDDKNPINVMIYSNINLSEYVFGGVAHCEFPPFLIMRL